MFPFSGLRLLLPALVPSWRFFDAVTASPRIDYALLGDSGDRAEPWREFRPRPPALRPGTMLGRLLWNPQWNENLFLVSLAERLMGAATAQAAAHSQRELLLRVARHLYRQEDCDPEAWLLLRLRLVGRDGAGEAVASHVVYRSAPCRIADLLTP